MTDLHRRTLLATLGAATAAGTLPTAARANAPTTAETFLSVSRAVTGRTDLDPTLATRLLAAMVETFPGYTTRLTALAAVTQAGGTPEDILPRAEQVNVAATMKQLIAAWYTGSSRNTMHAPMVAYYDALMYRPTRDALPVPTYCFAEPGWWTQIPPALGIPATAPKPATPPPPPPVAVETKPPPTTKVLPNKAPPHR